MGARTKYKKKYAKELLDGLRRTGYTWNEREYSWSIDALCAKWGITPATYHNWRNEFKSFDEACEIGDRDYRIYWMEKMEDGVALGKSANGALLKLFGTNILGMTDKKEVAVTSTENKIHRIEIEVIPPQKQIEKSNIIDITPIHEQSKIKAT